MILLDTHGLLWLDQGNSRLGNVALQRWRYKGGAIKVALKLIESAMADGGVSVSAISFWEKSDARRKAPHRDVTGFKCVAG